MEATKEKHAFTPGPWEIVNLQDKLKLYSKENRYCCDQPIATCEPRDINERAYKINHANARLIAAAPELLEQCKLFEKVLCELKVQSENCAYAEYAYHQLKENGIDLDKLREVLAKVDGGEG